MATIDPAAPHILVVDDDRRIRELLTSYLAGKGFRVTAAGNAGQARERMRGMAFDLLVLDVMMPGESGLELVRSLRAAADGVPVLILSALADSGDRITGLSSGSDDYLAKPFEPAELLLRIQSILRRQPARTAPTQARFGTCTFNPERGELRRGDELVRLTSRERDLMRLFVQKAGQTLSRDELAQTPTEGARSIDVQINRLRRKIEDDPSFPVYLQTVRGAGYILHLD
ncbi:MAG TPA: response regulator [Thermomicrobiales bacterium]|nr:response regulator [Thermomicrobiales bacterium]